MNFCTEQVQHDLILVWRNPPQELQKEIRKKDWTTGFIS